MEAKSQLASHEKLCTERWEQSRSTMNEVRADVKALLYAHERQAGAVSFGRTAGQALWAVLGAVAVAAVWLITYFAPHT